MTDWRDMSVMVTGGAGFLGKHVVARLEALDCDRVFVVRSDEYDLVHEDNVVRLFEDHPCDVVFHLAGYVGGIGANQDYPADFFYRNLMMGALVLHYAWQYGAKKVVAAGAGCGYPEDAPLPIHESEYWNGLPQWESLPYSLAKRMLHVQSNAYWRQHQFPVLVAIPGNIYGPDDNFDLEAAHVVPALVRKFVEAADDGKPYVEVWGRGTATRDFVYAGDVARGLTRMAERLDEPALINLSRGEEMSIREVVDHLATITAYEGEIRWLPDRPEGQSRRLFDVSKARTEIGFSCDTTLYEGLQKTVAWYRANRDSARNTVAPPLQQAAVPTRPR